MFIQTHQEILYLKEIFKNVHLRLVNALDHLQNHCASIDNAKTTTPRAQNIHDHSKRSLISELGKIVMCAFGGESSGRYSKAIIDKIKENLPILQ